MLIYASLNMYLLNYCQYINIYLTFCFYVPDNLPYLYCIRMSTFYYLINLLHEDKPVLYLCREILALNLYNSVIHLSIHVFIVLLRFHWHDEGLIIACQYSLWLKKNVKWRTLLHNFLRFNETLDKCTKKYQQR